MTKFSCSNFLFQTLTYDGVQVINILTLIRVNERNILVAGTDSLPSLFLSPGREDFQLQMPFLMSLI